MCCSDNYVGGVGAKVLANVVIIKQADKSSQTTVCCSDNYVGGIGARVLANALQKNSTLQELYIKGNDMGNEGIKALCGALSERETSFRVLDAGNNRQAIPSYTLCKKFPQARNAILLSPGISEFRFAL